MVLPLEIPFRLQMEMSSIGFLWFCRLDRRHRLIETYRRDGRPRRKRMRKKTSFFLFLLLLFFPKKINKSNQRRTRSRRWRIRVRGRSTGTGRVSPWAVWPGTAPVPCTGPACGRTLPCPLNDPNRDVQPLEEATHTHTHTQRRGWRPSWRTLPVLDRTRLSFLTCRPRKCRRK